MLGTAPEALGEEIPGLRREELLLEGRETDAKNFWKRLGGRHLQRVDPASEGEILRREPPVGVSPH